MPHFSRPTSVKKLLILFVRVFLHKRFLAIAKKAQRSIYARLIIFLASFDTTSNRPLFSILLPTYNSDPRILKKCVNSVLTQAYTNWELCVVDDGSTNQEIRQILESYSRKEPRIKIEFSERNEGIAATIHKASRHANGEFVGVLDHDDELDPLALYEYYKVIKDKPDTDCIYCDEDKIDTNGLYCFPWFKSDWNHDLLLSFNYIMHFVLCRRSIFEEVGGVRKQYEGSQDYDFILRVSEITQNIIHIPKVLYHWRMGEESIAAGPGAKPGVFVSGLKALNDALRRRGIVAKAEDAPNAWKGVYKVNRNVSPDIVCSILLFSNGNIENLTRLLNSITKYRLQWNIEIILCTPSQISLRQLDLNNAGIPIRVIATENNIAAAFNEGSKCANGNVLFFLDDTMELVSKDSFSCLLEHVQRSEIGAVGGKVYYNKDLVEHAGIILGCYGVVGYANRATSNNPGYAGLKNMIGNFSAVMGLGMMTRKDVFQKEEGFDPQLGLAYWDTDYCLRLRQKKYLITYTPYAEFYHHVKIPSASEVVVYPEADILKKRWSSFLSQDPYFNPNFSRKFENFRLKWNLRLFWS